VLTDCAVQFTLEQAVEGFLFRVTNLLGEAFDGNATPLVVGDLQILLTSTDLSGWFGQEVLDLFVIDLSIAYSNSYRLVKLVLCQSVKLCDCPRHHATVLEDCRAARHRVCLSGACLPVTEDCSVVALNYWLHDFGGSHFVGFILACIVQDFFEVKLPMIRLIVNFSVF